MVEHTSNCFVWVFRAMLFVHWWSIGINWKMNIPKDKSEIFKLKMKAYKSRILVNAIGIVDAVKGYLYL